MKRVPGSSSSQPPTKAPQNLSTERATPAFVREASKLLDDMERGLESFAVTERQDCRLRVAGGAANPGHLMMAYDSVGYAEVELQSPISGTLKYVIKGNGMRRGRRGRAAAEAKLEWVNADDGHSLVGIVTRDLLQMGCIGLPDFDSP